MSSSSLENPFFSSYLLKTHLTISMYNSDLLSGKSSLKSSQRMHNNAVLRGFDIRQCKSDLDLISLRSLLAECSMFPKYLQIKFLASFCVNPTISHRLSQ